jgi:hypothetical protein
MGASAQISENDNLAIFTALVTELSLHGGVLEAVQAEFNAFEMVGRTMQRVSKPPTDPADTTGAPCLRGTTSTCCVFWLGIRFGCVGLRR